jgi:hypothetical protein
VRIGKQFSAHIRDRVVVLSPTSVAFLMYYIQNKILTVEPSRIRLPWEEWITVRA